MRSRISRSTPTTHCLTRAKNFCRKPIFLPLLNHENRLATPTSIKFNLAQVKRRLTESDRSISDRDRYRRMKELSRTYGEYEKKIRVFVGEGKPEYVEHDGSFFAIVIFDGR